MSTNTSAIKRAALYARVSTADKGQNPENQLEQLREYCRRQGWTITVEYIDHDTAKHGNRDAFKRLFDDASSRAFDVLVVWALDRLTREGVWETFAYIRKLAGCGVQFESFTEAHFRTTGPAGELMLAIAAWIAKQERILNGRTDQGGARKSAEGRQGHRPSEGGPRQGTPDRSSGLRDQLARHCEGHGHQHRHGRKAYTGGMRKSSGSEAAVGGETKRFAAAS